MNKQTEALKMAIEFLNDIGEQTYAIHGWQKIEKLNATIQACKEALEQPSWQGLSDDEINDIVNKIRDDMYPWKDGMLVGKVARAIEQALKEKNHGC